MALIKLSPEDQAEGVLADIYQATKERMGFLPNSIKLFAHNIGVLLGTLKIFEAYTEGSNINPEIFTLIRYSVAHARGSKYCINMNSKILQQTGFDPELVDNAHGHWTQFPISDSEKELVGFAVKVATDPENISAEDIENLKTLGWSETDIFTAADQAARMLYGSTMLKAFKVKPDE